MEWLHPVFALKRPPGVPAPAAPGPADHAASGPRTDHPSRYLCGACGLVLAQRRDRVAVHGRTEHERINPVGFPHRFVTVKRCDNWRALGEPTADFTWFDGCAWEIILCAGCAGHLGWRWSGESTFFGLLRSAVVETSGDG